MDYPRQRDFLSEDKQQDEQEYQQRLEQQVQDEADNAYSAYLEERADFGYSHYDLGIEDGRPGLEPDAMGVGMLVLRILGVLVLVLAVIFWLLK